MESTQSWSLGINQWLGGTEVTMRIAIVGSRNYPRPDLVEAFVGGLPYDTVVVSGGARGVDSIAEETAKARGLQTVIFYADWENLGRRAGPIRNAQIIDHADRLAAFWDGRSRGTLSTVVLANRAGLPIEIFGPEGDILDLKQVLEAAEERGAIASISSGETYSTATRSTKN